MSYLTDHGNGESPKIIFDALPVHEAESFMVLIIVYSLCLGMILLETVKNLRFDYNLIRKPGWTHFPKIISRLAYLFCRYLPLACLTLVLVFLTNKLDNCKAIPLAFNILGMILLDSISLIFVQRTMALYAWKRKVVVPLTIIYLIVVAMSLVCVPFYGVGERIPNSEFCAYDTRRSLKRVLVANVTYKSTSMVLDLILLVLTLNRLVDGGIRTLFRSNPRRMAEDLFQASLSSFLIRQGFHFYVLQTATEIIFVSVYFSTQEVSYQVLGSALLFSIPPIAACTAFREMGKKASTLAPRSTKVNEIMNSSNSPSGDASGAQAVSRDRRQPSNAGISSTPAIHVVSQEQRGADPGYGLGISSQSTYTQEKGRMSWANRKNSRSSGRSGPSNGGNGVLVTIGTVSRTDDIEEGWEDGSPRYSSDNADPDGVELRRQYPGLSRKASQQHAKAGHSSSGHGAYGGMDSKESFNEVVVPNLEQSNRISPPAGASPWIPQTPTSPYPTGSPYTHHDTMFDRVTFPASTLSPTGRERVLSGGSSNRASPSFEPEPENAWRTAF